MNKKVFFFVEDNEDLKKVELWHSLSSFDVVWSLKKKKKKEILKLFLK